MRTKNIKQIISKYKWRIPRKSVNSLISDLSNAPDDCFDGLMQLKTKSRLKCVLLSFLLLDRFYIGDFRTGILKIVLIASVILIKLAIPLTDFPTMQIVDIIVNITGFFTGIWVIVDTWCTLSTLKIINLTKISLFLQSKKII